MANFNLPGSGGHTPGNGAQWCIVRTRASGLITDVPAFVNFHSSILSYLRRVRPRSGSYIRMVHLMERIPSHPAYIAVRTARVQGNASH